MLLCSFGMLILVYSFEIHVRVVFFFSYSLRPSVLVAPESFFFLFAVWMIYVREALDAFLLVTAPCIRYEMMDRQLDYKVGGV